MKAIKKALEIYKNLSKPAKASLWFVICGFLQRGVSVLTTPIFTRLMNTEEYGVYNVFNSWLEVLTVIVTLKLAAGVYAQGLVKHDKDKDVFASSLLGLATTITLTWFIVYLVFHKVINDLLGLSTLLMVAMFAMMISTVGYNFWSVKERVDYKYKKLIIVALIVTVMKPLFGIIAVLTNESHKAEARIVAIAVVEVVAYAGFYITIMSKGKKPFHKSYWKYALAFNIPLIPHYLSQNILNHSDRLMINAIVGMGAAGVYSLAYNLSSIMTLFNKAINNSLAPWIYRCIKKNQIKRIDEVSYILLIMIAAINLLLIGLAPEAVAIFAPKSYGEAIWVIPPVTMAVYFKFTYCLFANFEFYFEKTGWVMVASVVGAVLNIILNAIFIPIYGYIAAAYTTLVCYMVYSFLHYLFMRKACEKHTNGVQPYNTRKIVLISGVFIIVGFVLMGLYNYRWARYLVVLLLCAVMYIKRQFFIDSIKTISKKKQYNIEKQNSDILD